MKLFKIRIKCIDGEGTFAQTHTVEQSVYAPTEWEALNLFGELLKQSNK